MQNKINKIKEFINNNNYEYVDIQSESSINKIYDLIFENKVTNVNNSNEMFYFGQFYHIKKDYDNMMKYYLLAIDQKNEDAMCNLGYYYDRSKNYDSAIKYYLMTLKQKNNNSYSYSYAENSLGRVLQYFEENNNHNNIVKYYLIHIEQKDSNAMNCLAMYYKKIKSYDLAIKYFNMAIEHNNDQAMNNLASYYLFVEKNHDMALKYYILGLEHKNIDAMSNLLIYYEQKNDYDNAFKYALMAFEKNMRHSYNRLLEILKTRCINESLYDKLIDFCLKTNMKKELIEILKVLLTNNKNKITPYIFDILLETDFTGHDVPNCINIIKNLLSTKIDLLDVHFKYSPESTGYQGALDNFNSCKNELFTKIIK